MPHTLRNKPSAALALIAGIGGLIYVLLFTWPFPLSRLYATIPPVDYAKLTGHSAAGLAAYVLGLGGLFGLYLAAIHISRQTPQLSHRFIMLTSALLAAISIPAYPLSAIDLFIYAIRTRGWALYGLNPLATAPDRLPPTDPWLGLTGEWLDAASPYGPVWEWLSLGIFHLSGGNYPVHLFALKIVAALAYLGCVGLVYQILQRSRPDWAATGTIAFAWNPLVLLESVQNGHNDILMAFFLLAAIASFQKTETRIQKIGPVLMTLFFLSMSILVKFVTAVTVPFFLLAITAHETNWPRRLLKMGLSGLVIVGLVIGLMRPLWPGLEAWAVLQAGSGAGRSLLALLILGLREVFSLNTAFDLSRGAVNIGFGMIYLYYLGRAIFMSTKPASRQSALISPIFYILFWYILLAAPVFHAWYLLWFVPLASLINQKTLAATIVFSITALLVIPYFETMRVWYPVLLQNHLLGHLIGVPLLILPPAMTLLRPISPK